MRKNKSVRILTVGLLIMMVFGVIVFGQLTVNAIDGNGQVSKKEMVHDIAIVFDNSASMYAKNNNDNPKLDVGRDRWVYAKYAMGVFASMIDYSKDNLAIFPMWPITTNSAKNNVITKLEIKNASDVENISRIYTPTPDYTPTSVCDEAKSFLDGKPSQDEKWLIILTDGEFTDENVKKVPSDKVKDKLNNWSSNGVKIQFLTFGDGKKYGADNGKTIFEDKVKSPDALEDSLIEICNTIFNRDELSKNDFFESSSGKITLNVSSGSLFIFDQGKNSSLKLVDSKGKQVGHETPIFVYGDKNGTFSAGKSPGKSHNYFNLAKSINYPSLNGSVVLFDKCIAGQYSLSGFSKKVRIFYEPDVYVNVSLKKDGKKIKQSELNKGLNPEEYEIEYALYDSQTNKPVPEKAQLHENLKAYVNSNGNTKEYKNGDKIKFDPDQDVDIEVRGDYLDGKYQISSKDNESINLKGIKIFSEKECYKVKVNVKQIAGLYTLMEHEGWKPIRIDITRDGKKLTEEELKDVKISFSEKIPFSKKMLVKESAYEIEIGKTEGGKYIEPQSGNYKITASIKHADEFGREMTGSDSSGFRITPLPAWLIWLIWILAILLLIALIIFILNLPAWPAKMVCEITEPSNAKGTYPIHKGKSITLVPYKWPLACDAKKASKVWNKITRKGGKIIISNITPDRHADSYSIGGKTYQKLDPFPPTTISSGKLVEIDFNTGAQLKAKIKLN